MKERGHEQKKVRELKGAKGKNRDFQTKRKKISMMNEIRANKEKRF